MNSYDIETYKKLFKHKGNCYGVIFSCATCGKDLRSICRGESNYTDVQGSLTLKRLQYATKMLVAVGECEDVFDDAL